MELLVILSIEFRMKMALRPPRPQIQIFLGFSQILYRKSACCIVAERAQESQSPEPLPRDCQVPSKKYRGFPRGQLK